MLNGCLRRGACALLVAVMLAAVGGKAYAQQTNADELPRPVWIFLEKKLEDGVPDGKFTFSASGDTVTTPALSIELTTVNGVSPLSKDSFGARPGTVTISETSASNTKLTDVSCHQHDAPQIPVDSQLTGAKSFSVIVPDVEQGIDCTVTNGPAIVLDPPTITVVKQINEGGAELRNDTFTVNISGAAEKNNIKLKTELPNYISPESEAVTIANSGSVTITEVQQPGFELTGAFCNIDDVPGQLPYTPVNGSFTVPEAVLDSIPLGGNITCTLVNTPRPIPPPTLTVIKKLNKDELGNLAGGGPFTIDVSGGASAQGVTLSVAAGASKSDPSNEIIRTSLSAPITISERRTDRFDLTTVSCRGDDPNLLIVYSSEHIASTPVSQSITLSKPLLKKLGANITCTLLNTPRSIPTPTLPPPTVTVVKQVELGDGHLVGNPTFTVDVSGVATANGVPLQVLQAQPPSKPTSNPSAPIPLTDLFTGATTLTITEARKEGFDLTGAFCTTERSVDRINFSAAQINSTDDTQSITLTEGDLDTLLSGGNITCTLVNTLRPIPTPPGGDTYLTITKVTIGGNGTFTFAGSEGTVFDRSVTTSGGRGTTDRILVNAGPLTVTEERLPKGVTLVDIACAGGSPRNDLANRRVNLTVRSGENIVCIFTNRIITTTIIRDFMRRRAEHLTGDTGRPRLIERRRSFAAPSLKDSLGAYGGGSLKDGKAGYRTSLRRAFGDRTAAKAARYGVNPGDYGVATGASGHRSGLDVWSEGRLNYFETDGANGTSGHFGVVRVGADYLLTPSVLIGFLAQYDRLSEDGDGYAISGHGFMVGPYVEYEVGKGLYFDAKALWGTSTNKVSPFDTYTDEFSTTRWLVAARLTGSWSYRVSHQSAWHFSPRAEIVYFSETSESYTDSNNVRIDGQRVSLGRVKAGPEISYRYTTRDGTRIEPRVSAKGLWAFGNGTARSLDPAFTSSVSERPVDDFQLQLGGGLVIEDPSGLRLDIEGNYTGLAGSDTRSAGGKVNVTIPLQKDQ